MPETTAKRIGEMKPGDEGWTVPWAVHEPSGWRWLRANYYINFDYPLDSVPGGTVTLKVRKDNSGWHIDDSTYRKGFGYNGSDRYHLYWRNGRSVPVRSVTL